MMVLSHLPPPFMQLFTHPGFGHAYIGLMPTFPTTNLGSYKEGHENCRDINSGS